MGFDRRTRRRGRDAEGCKSCEVGFLLLSFGWKVKEVVVGGERPSVAVRGNWGRAGRTREVWAKSLPSPRTVVEVDVDSSLVVALATKDEASVELCYTDLQHYVGAAPLLLSRDLGRMAMVMASGLASGWVVG